MRRTIIIISLSLLWAGCSKNNPVSPTTNVINSNDLQVTFSIPQSSYGAHDTLVATTKVYNPADTTVNLYVPVCWAITSYSVQNSSGTSVLSYNAPRNLGCNSIVHYSILPHQSQQISLLSVIVPIANLDTTQTSQGSYLLKVNDVLGAFSLKFIVTAGGDSVSGSWTEVSGLKGFTNIIASGSDLFAGGDGVFRSTDDGITWKMVDSINNTSSGPLAIMDSVIFYGAGGKGIYVSSDRGSTWMPMDQGLPGQPGNYPAAACLAVNGRYVFMGTLTNGVFRSDGPMGPWNADNSGLDPGYHPGFSAPCVYCLAVSGEHIFAGTQFSLSASTNDGASWAAIDSGMGSSGYFIESLAVNGDNTFAATYDSHLFKSTDFGVTWANIVGNLPVPEPLPGAYAKWGTSLAASSTTLFITFENGIFASASNDSTWTNITGNIPFNGGTGKVAVVGNCLFYSMQGGGVWRISF